MPIYYGGKKISSLYYGGKKIASAWYGGKVIYRDVVVLFSGPKTSNGYNDYINVDIPAGTKSIVIKLDKYITSATAKMNDTPISIKKGCIIFPVKTGYYQEYITGTVSFYLLFDDSSGKNVLQIGSAPPGGFGAAVPVTVVGIYAG
ncbi:hypothetical protein [Schleiferilactobacillus harbinensis]|uniref:hypothetical protein n=1 Tax=Schleiferilactobacillus harbinensis TaxID=304207 RepID=UPI0039EB856C